MGISITTHLMFGIVLGEEFPEKLAVSEDEEFPDFDDWIIRTMDPDDSTISATGDKARRHIIKNYPYDITYLTSSDYPTYVLFFRDSHQTRSWGSDPKPLDMAKFEGTYHVDALQLFCDQNGIEFKQPEWIMGADYSY